MNKTIAMDLEADGAWLLKVLLRHLPGETEENHEKYQTR
jgi:hypothetical protein